MRESNKEKENTALIYLRNALSEQLEKNQSVLSCLNQQNRAQSLEVIKADDEKEEDQIILDINESFFSKGHQAYVEMLAHNYSVDRNTTLAIIMFGRTVATIMPDKDYSIKNPYEQSNAYYHRTDLLNGALFDNILEKFYPNPDHLFFYYIPVILLNSTPIDEMISKHLSNYWKYLEIKKKDGAKIAFIKIAKKEILIDERLRLMSGREKICEKILSTLQSIGLVATPWAIADYCSTQYSVVIENFTKRREKIPSVDFPNSIEDKSFAQLMKNLKNIGMSTDTIMPTRELAACAYELINGLLPFKIHIDENIVRRIYIFLSMAIKFNRYNYNNFSILLNSAIHEITLLSCKLADEASFNLVNFDDFKREIFRNSLKELCVKDEDDATNNKFWKIAFPAISGTNAFSLAMKLAESMSGTKKSPVISFCDPLYYEFERLYQGNREKSHADIFIISTGAIVGVDEIMPAVDINNFIREKIKTNNKFTIVVDSSSGLYSDLRLDKAVASLVESGCVSIRRIQVISAIC